MSAGLVPIIAHVERYRWLSPQAPLLQERKAWLPLQCNVEAVENGDAGPYVEADMVDLLPRTTMVMRALLLLGTIAPIPVGGNG